MRGDTQPVLIGVAQATWREQGEAGSPLDALERVAREALKDSGSEAVASALDAVVHTPFIMTQVEGLKDAMPANMGSALAARLGVEARQYSADVGGNLPQQFVNAMAGRLALGKDSVVLLCGVELLATFLGSLRAGNGFPDWAGAGSIEPEALIETPVMTAPTEQVHGLFEPINAYPLFESALRHAKGLSVEEHSARLGGLISRMSQVAADNPHAWKQQRLTPAEVVSCENRNRMICFPYTKVMNSVIAVDQAAAVVMTTAQKAREMGVDEGRWVYLRGGASAHDTWFLGERKALHRSPALKAASAAAMAQAGFSIDQIDCFDLYSCFPSAVQVACDELGIAIDDPRGLTVTGGMSLFGGPGNNYSLHAIAGLVERLRSGSQEHGVVTANGGYLTKHAVGVYSRCAGDTAWTPPDEIVLQVAVDTGHGPQLAGQGDGSIAVEAHTVKYKGEEPESAILIGSLEDGRRCVATSDAADVIEAFLTEDCVGMQGVVTHSDGINRFRL